MEGVPVAERTYQRDGEDLVVTMFKPEPYPRPMDADPTMPPYRCNLLFTWPGGELRRYAVGIDAFQALELAQKLAHNELRVMRDSGVAIRLWGEEDLALPTLDLYAQPPSSM